MLSVCLQQENSWPYWREAKPSDSLVVGYDPVAVDTLGLRLFGAALTANGRDPKSTQDKASQWLAAAAALGVGTNEEKNMKVAELMLG